VSPHPDVGIFSTFFFFLLLFIQPIPSHPIPSHSLPPLCSRWVTTRLEQMYMHLYAACTPTKMSRKYGMAPAEWEAALLSPSPFLLSRSLPVCYSAFYSAHPGILSLPMAQCRVRGYPPRCNAFLQTCGLCIVPTFGLGVCSGLEPSMSYHTCQ